MESIECKIERTRKKLLKTAKEQGLSSKETIKLSVELDHLLNVYSYNDVNTSVENNPNELLCKKKI